MAKPLSILCVHGVGHGDIDPDLEGFWSKAIHIAPNEHASAAGMEINPILPPLISILPLYIHGERNGRL